MGSSVEKGFHVADFVIFGGVLFTSLGIGLYHAFTGGKQRTTKEYFLANRNLQTLPVAMSILVSFVSAILVLGTPAEMYTRGTELFMRTIGYCLAVALSSALFVPLFFPLKVTSSFEYLERRYHSKVIKLMGTVMMIVGNLFYMGLVMYSPSTALEAVTGFPLWASIVACGMVSTVYTTLGGMKAVIWTDVFQAIVMLGGMLAIVIQGTIKVGGLSKIWNISGEGGRLIFFNFNPDPTQRLSFWSLVIGGMFSSLTIFGIGQTSVQRYCALPTLKQAKRSVYLNIPGLVMVNVLASLVGLVVYAYYAQTGCDPLAKGYISNANQLVPYFVIDVLDYPGFPGIFLAVLFCGALSSMSSSLNALAAVTWQDMLQYCLGHFSEIRKTFITKILVVCYGVAAIGMSFMAEYTGGHVLQASLSFTGATTGPILGVFLLGALFPSANAQGAITGSLVSIAFSLWIAIGTFITKPYKRTRLPTSTEHCQVENTTRWRTAATIGADNYNYASLLNNLANNPNQTELYDRSLVYNTATQNNSNLLEYLTTTDAIIPSQQPADTLVGIEKLYGISFLWYSAMGAIITIVIGLIISWISDYFTGNDTRLSVDRDLIIPVGERLCCCLPKSLRRRLQPDLPQKYSPDHSDKAKDIHKTNIPLVKIEENNTPGCEEAGVANNQHPPEDSTTKPLLNGSSPLTS